VLVCAYRTFFPSIYLFRDAWFDTPLNSTLLARLLASVGEVCWMTQVAMAVHRNLAQVMERRRSLDGWTPPHVVQVVPAFVVFLICCAECFSCTGTITTNSMWFMLEEGSWVLSGWLLAPISFWMLYSMYYNPARPYEMNRSAYRFLVGLSAWLVIYCPWGVVSDVPANYRRWQDEVNNGTVYFSFADGLEDAANKRNVTHDWDTWSPYLLWMTSYFSVGVWSSIALMFAPQFAPSNSLLVQDSSSVPDGMWNEANDADKRDDELRV